MLTCFLCLCGGSWRNREASDPLLWAGTRERVRQERGTEAEWASGQFTRFSRPQPPPHVIVSSVPCPGEHFLPIITFHPL